MRLSSPERRFRTRAGIEMAPSMRHRLQADIPKLAKTHKKTDDQLNRGALLLIPEIHRNQPA
jgi:hypothetical protein